MLATTDIAPPGTRVLLTADSVGGVWTYAVDLARGLSARGCAVTLAVLGPAPDGGQEREAAAIPRLDLRPTGLPLDWTAGSRREVLAAGVALARLATTVAAGLVHLHSPALAAGTRFPAPLLATCHSCVGTWWDAVHGAAPLPPDLAWRADLVAEGCRAVDALLAPTRAFARATAHAYGLETEPAVVPNGHDPASGSPGGSVTEPSCFTAGRLWDDGKNVRLLDAAAALTDVPIAAAGALAGPHGVSVALPRLRCPGQLSGPEIAARLAGRPIYASPALYEPFGLSVLEAAARGCPLLLSDIPTFRELWDGAATFLPPRDPAAWADAIDRLAADGPAREAAGARARDRSRRFALDRTVKGTLDVYGRLLGRTVGSRTPAARSAA